MFLRLWRGDEKNALAMVRKEHPLFVLEGIRSVGGSRRTLSLMSPPQYPSFCDNLQVCSSSSVPSKLQRRSLSTC